MKIRICGSMNFANQMIEAKKELEELGHEVVLPCDIDIVVKGLFDINDPEADFEHCVKNDIIRKDFNTLAESDAVLALNHLKNGVNGYIGASTLMEIGLAYYLKKKIFLLNPPPHVNDASYAQEINIMQPVILNGDFSRIQSNL